MHTLLIAWVVSLMTGVSPPARDAKFQSFPGWAETTEAREERYESIASDLVSVVFDEEEQPLPGTTREETARIVLAIMFHESGFAKDVDVGPCYRGKGFASRCGGGRAVCLMQLEAWGRGTVDGRSRAELEGSRRTCIRAGLHVARKSYSICKKPDTRLNFYATGTCDRGTANTQMKLATARSFAPFPEREILAVDP